MAGTLLMALGVGLIVKAIDWLLNGQAQLLRQLDEDRQVLDDGRAGLVDWTLSSEGRCAQTWSRCGPESQQRAPCDGRSRGESRSRAVRPL